MLRSLALATALLVGALAAPAHAGGWWHFNPKCDPDSVGSGVVTITDTITGHFFSFDVDYEVFAADNCANPKPATIAATASAAETRAKPRSLRSTMRSVVIPAAAESTTIARPPPLVRPSQIRGASARLYVHGSDQPTLVVNDLKLPPGPGAVALWIGPGTEAYFSNLRVGTAAPASPQPR